MALKNQKDKNVKGASPIRKPQLKGKQTKQKKPQNPGTNFLAKETLPSLTQSFSIMFHNHAKIISFCELKFCCFV